MKQFATLALYASLSIATACDAGSAAPDDGTTLFSTEVTVEERGYLLGRGIDPASLRTPGTRVSVAPMRSLASGADIGRSRLIRFPDGVLATISTSEFDPGTAVTMWMIVFNAPEHCSDGVCGSDDLRDPRVRADVLGADGAVIGRNGRARFHVLAREGDTTGSIAEAFLGLSARGVENVRAAEIHFVIRTHGPVIEGREREMTSTFNGGCVFDSLPDDPELGRPGPNTCVNLQAAIHLP